MTTVPLTTGLQERLSDHRFRFGAYGVLSQLALCYPNLADHQVIEQHLYGGQVLLDRLRRTWVLLDIGRDEHRCNQPDVINVIF